jgi:REP element-mobilizing transposase RayT
MPNHVHALMTPLDSFELEDIVASIKKHSAKTINKAKGCKGQLWQYESYDHIVRDQDELKHFRRYMVENPGKAFLNEGQFTQVVQGWMNEWVP